MFAMITNQLNSGLGQPKFPNMSALGIIFFILGAPNIYAFLNRPAESPRSNRAPRYAWFALVAMAIAGIVELSVI